MSETAHRLRGRLWTIAGGVAAIAFLVLAGRFWHPYYGFTKFVQLDEADARIGIREVREHPVFAYEGFNGYDGAAYTQIAFHPLLDSSELQPALGNVPYRARRILGSAVAWVLAGGQPARIATTYAALNLGVWLLLAVLLWRILPVRDGRGWLAWTGVMFSAGALHSVRLALTDLLAAALVAGAIHLNDRNRDKGALGLLAAAGLARETALAAVVGLWRGPWKTLRGQWANGARIIAVTVPLLVWMAYVRWKAGPAAQGLGNFTWPAIGWLEKWLATFADFSGEPNFRWLNTTTLFAVAALTAQSAFFLVRWRQWRSAWWRVGISGVAMMIFLGTSVWEGHPGAATRVLLPMSVAFAVLAVRERAGLGWIAAGSLSLFSGVLALWHVPNAPREIAAGRTGEGAYVVRLGPGWHGVERASRSAWAWGSDRAELLIHTHPRAAQAFRVRLKLRAITPRALEIRGDEGVIWRGQAEERAHWIEFAATSRPNGDLQVYLSSDTPPVPENDQATARQLGFAVYGVELALAPMP